MVVLNLPDIDVLLYKYELLLKPTEKSLFDEVTEGYDYFNNQNGVWRWVYSIRMVAMKEMERVHSKIGV